MNPIENGDFPLFPLLAALAFFLKKMTTLTLNGQDRFQAYTHMNSRQPKSVTKNQEIISEETSNLFTL